VKETYDRDIFRNNTILGEIYVFKEDVHGVIKFGGVVGV
jgi:hypothetical protein